MTADPPIDLSAIDSSGALAEARERAERHTRAELLRRAGVAAMGVALLGPVAAAAGAGTSAGDVDILNYALTLEYLQANFYTQAERSGALHGPPASTAGTIGAVERAHVAAFRKLLGRAAVSRPSFDFQGVTENQDAFIRTAVAFEDLAVAAYKGQLPLIRSPQVVAGALSIHSVEARHAAWIRYLAGVQPASEALDAPMSRAQTERLVASTHFIVTRPRTRGTTRPRFTG